MFDSYWMNEADFMVQGNAELLVNDNQIMGQGMCALNTKHNGLKAFMLKNGTCLMGSISQIGKPDPNGSRVFVDPDHARDTLDYGEFCYALLSNIY